MPVQHQTESNVLFCSGALWLPTRNVSGASLETWSSDNDIACFCTTAITPRNTALRRSTVQDASQRNHLCPIELSSRGSVASSVASFVGGFIIVGFTINGSLVRSINGSKPNFDAGSTDAFVVWSDRSSTVVRTIICSDDNTVDQRHPHSRLTQQQRRSQQQRSPHQQTGADLSRWVHHIDRIDKAQLRPVSIPFWHQRTGPERNGLGLTAPQRQGIDHLDRLGYNRLAPYRHGSHHHQNNTHRESVGPLSAPVSRLLANR